MKIEKAYYINLDSRKKKKEFMERQLGSCGLPYSRIPGVDLTEFSHFNIVDSIRSGSLRHKGTVGCFLAHQRCLEAVAQESQKTGSGFYAIFEDDVGFDCGIFETISSLVLPNEFEILLINSALQYPGKPAPDPRYLVSESIYRVYTIYPVFLGAFFYVLNVSTALKVLDKMKKVKVYEDYDMFLFKNFECYTYINGGVYVEKFKSDRDVEAKYNLRRFEG